MPAPSNPELIEQMRAQLRQIQERRARNELLLAKLGQAGASTISPDGTVTVLTGPGGAVTEVRLADQAMRLDAATLGRTITATIRNAAAAAAPQTQNQPVAPVPTVPTPPPAPRPVRTKRPDDPYDEEPIATVFDA